MSVSYFSPSAIDEPVAPVINSILDASIQKRLVLCAGAGLSVADPAALPSGAALGRKLDERLAAMIAGYTSPSNPDNLIDVADVAALLEDGESVLRTEILKLAPFLEADPNYGHQMIAELLCEGTIEVVLLWNWDNCIERVDVAPEQLAVARSKADLDDLNQPSIAKVHGCATRKTTLLVTSADLSEQAPPWTQAAFRERLRGTTVVFVGIGDVADYAERRLNELRLELEGQGEGNELDIWVVSPDIRDEWNTSGWAKLVPDLPEERKVAMRANEFFDQLGRRWVSETLAEVEQLAAQELQTVTDSVQEVCRAVRSLGAAPALRWCRRAAIGQLTGESVMSCDGLKEVLLGSALLSDGSPVEARGPAALLLGERRLEALVACKALGASRVRERARQRAENLSNQGILVDRAEFLVAGAVVGELHDDDDIQLDVVAGSEDADDLIAGASGVRLSFTRAGTLLSEAG